MVFNRSHQAEFPLNPLCVAISRHDAIDFLIKEILHSPDRYIDHRYVNVFYEHKKVMYQRFIHMQHKELASAWLSLQNTWQTILYLSLRYNKYIEMGKSVPAQLKKILDMIISARDAELLLLEKLLTSRR